MMSRTALAEGAAGIRRLRLSLELLLDRRWGTFLAVDLAILFILAVAGLAGGNPEGMYPVAFTPYFIPGLMVMCNSVALERAAGSLDLALTSPGASWYFDRRVFGFVALLAAQTIAFLGITRLFMAPFPFLPVLIQSLVSSCLIGATALFWSARLKTGQSAAMAALGTLILLSPWLLHSPVVSVNESGWWLRYETSIEWLETNLVLAGAAGVIYLYARRRLSRTEVLIT